MARWSSMTAVLYMERVERVALRQNIQLLIIWVLQIVPDQTKLLRLIIRCGDALIIILLASVRRGLRALRVRHCPPVNWDSFTGNFAREARGWHPSK